MVPQIRGTGYSVAQYNLGRCCHDGCGIEKDYYEAVKWYRKAAEQGHAAAQCNLGVCYYNGDGVEPNRAEAVRWLRKSADQGNENAEKLLKEIGADDRPLDYLRYYRYVESGMMPKILRRGETRFTSSLELYIAGCRTFGWDERKKNGFGMYSSVYANRATEENFGVWCPCNNNLCFDEKELNEKGIRDYIYENHIVEHVYDVTKQDLGRFDNEDVRVAFVKIPKHSGIYMFYGLVRCVDIEYEDYRGISKNHMIRTFELISDKYPDSDIDPLG